MTTVVDHYEHFLAPIYAWMSGGAESALAQGAAEVEPWRPPPGTAPVAIDLGAGFGAHAIPMARAGYDVTAVDTSRTMLIQLRLLDRAAQVRTVVADLVDFRKHVTAKARLIVCLGDTLTHLARVEDVERLFSEVAAGLAHDGTFVMTFRAYTAPSAGDTRVILVRSDADRIHTCVLEGRPCHVRVHDIVHERHDSSWHLRASSYVKLRLSVPWVLAALARVGLEARAEPGPRGMVRIIAAIAPGPMPRRASSPARRDHSCTGVDR